MLRSTSVSDADYDALVRISDYELVHTLGDLALLGQWFAFLKPEWLARSGMDRLLASSGIEQAAPKAAILFRGQKISLPGATIEEKPLPQLKLLSLTSDKALYRAKRDTVRLLLAAPRQAGAELRLCLRLSGNPYAEYAVTLDEYGLALWSLQGLPEGEYEATIEESAPCRFEVAEYRLAALNAELVSQSLEGETLRYTLSVTAFGQPYSGPLEIELQERGQRASARAKKSCDAKGQCQGVFKLSGTGPYTLNVYAGERSATVALKGSEQERRATLTISELGRIHQISLLPLRDSEEWRGISLTRTAQNTQPFLVNRVLDHELEIEARTAVEMLRAVIVDPASNTHKEEVYENLSAGQRLRLPISAPYNVALLGALLDGKAWEGWCAALRPVELELSCEVPGQARPGERITVKLKTNIADRNVPVQLIVKDQRLIAPSDPQVELAACIKKHLTTWRESTQTGEVERQIAQSTVPYPSPPLMARRGRVMTTMAMPTSAPPVMASAPASGFPLPGAAMSYSAATDAAFVQEQTRGVATAAPPVPLAKVRLEFPEVIYNTILHVNGEASVSVKLGDSMTRYTVEAFALDSESLDWRRVESTIEAVQPVYGELTVSPFVFPGDLVMGRLDVGAASGSALVEVRCNEELLPLLSEDGREILPGQPVPSGATLRFPVSPGAITAIVRDARTGETDVSERYVTPPGKLRHIVRRLRLLTPGEEVTLQETHALTLKPIPGLERPFQLFVEGAVKYPFGCIEQTSVKVLSMYTGYITNREQPEIAREYEAAILIWVKRLKSMYLPQSGFCFYPPEEGGQSKPDTHYAPLAVKRLLNLPNSARSGIQQPALRELLDEIAAMVKDAAAYYKIERVPRKLQDCHDAYQVMQHGDNPQAKSKALAFARARLVERNGQAQVEVAPDQTAYHFWGAAVAQREQTAYAAATLLRGGERSDLPRAIAATNYLTSQLNEEGRLYSTVDTAAGLALLLALRAAGVVTTSQSGRVVLNGQEMSLADALTFNEKIERVRSLEGVIAVEVTSEVFEDWNTFKNALPVEVRLERNGRAQSRFRAGDALDLVIRVRQYEPGLLAHVCLPDALARVVGGGQVKRFSLDFCEKNELRVPLAALSATGAPGGKGASGLLKWLGRFGRNVEGSATQHWAVIVRNMFKEEQAGNPGILEVQVE